MKKKLILFILFFISALNLFAYDDVNQLIEEGIHLFENGSYNEALQKYNEALKISPENNIVYYEKAYVLVYLKRYKEALKLVKKNIGIEDKQIEEASYVLYGTILDLQNKKRESIRIYKEALKKHPDSYLLSYNLGITYYFIKDYLNAEKQFKNSLKNNPYHINSIYGLFNTEKILNNEINTLFTSLIFLLYEQDSERSKYVEEYLITFYKSRAGNEQDDVILNFSPEDDQFYSAMNLLIGITYTSILLEETKDEQIIYMKMNENIVKVAAELGEKENNNTFWYYYFINILSEIDKANLLDDYINIINYANDKEKRSEKNIKYKKIYDLIKDYFSINKDK